MHYIGIVFLTKEHRTSQMQGPPPPKNLNVKLFPEYLPSSPTFSLKFFSSRTTEEGAFSSSARARRLKHRRARLNLNILLWKCSQTSIYFQNTEVMAIESCPIVLSFSVLDTFTDIWYKRDFQMGDAILVVGLWWGRHGISNRTLLTTCIWHSLWNVFDLIC